MSEKTEQPTPKKLSDARKKGQVAKSKEIATSAIIIGLFGYIWMLFPFYLEHMQSLVLIPTHFYHLPFDQALIGCAKTGFKEFLILILPFTLTAFIIAALSYLFQIGPLISFESITPDLKKINPVEGFKRIFSLNNLLELAKSSIKILVLGCIIYLLIKDNIQNLLNIPQTDIDTVLYLLSNILKKLVVYATGIFFVICIMDHFFQKYLHIKKLKMSKDDVKREHKDQDGDPHQRSQRKQLQYEMAMDDIVGKIKESTVIITKSKKLAVVIYYEFGKTALPVIHLKAKKLQVEKVLALAKEYKIPIFPDARLTQNLFDLGEEGNYIPSKLVEPVAMVLRTVMGMGADT